MSRIRNSVYGLALGDALAYRTEFDDFWEIIANYHNEDVYKIEGELVISDDTQMSIYLAKAFYETYDSSKPVESQKVAITAAVAKGFISWLHDPMNNRAPGNACISSLEALEKDLASKTHKENKKLQVSDYLSGGARNLRSKGSGTVMRSPWIGLLHGRKIISDEMLLKFCHTQSAITHQHPTALHGSYLTALITSSLYDSSLEIGELVNFAKCFCAAQVQDVGWREISDALHRIDNLPENYPYSKITEYDPSEYIGRGGTAENVLATALHLIDIFGHDPVETLRRCMFTSGDSDTIGAVAGGIIGAAYDHDIWRDIEHVLERYYVPQLNEVSYQLSRVQAPTGFHKLAS